MADLKTIEDLTNAFGPSGFEEEVVKAVQKHCEGLNLRNDAMYNVYATMPDAKGNRPVFMLDAHTDECGFMVQNVEDNGLLSIITLGGFHMTSLPAHSVIVRNSKGEKIKGIITSKPVHFLTAGPEGRQFPDDRGIKGGCRSQQQTGDRRGLRNPRWRSDHAGCDLLL